eukprot:gnl/MRDRNA2_/MRDRNA2_58742_c0_seq1.p1 gnl/MRDRNA2_/MRDRNA2_58742_c0~~gnl/MRDRNA2_/MRDRNA2_58742_c0_seq1.p1  ORF type:complete len:624 (-),score=131.74 gnl/MRDRNA2_/MRDRNA2_58742_c0_seq1:29-1900(-)
MALSPRVADENTGFIDDTELPIFTVEPAENIYSYFMFINPTEHKKEGGQFTWDVLMAYILVALGWFIQGLFLYTIFNEVVVGNLEWQTGIFRVGGQDWNLISPKSEGCNDGGSLCVLDKGMYSCAPPSVQLTGRWEELDVNKDGIWTREEVMQEREKLKCKYVVDPVEVFDVFVNFLLQRENIIWIHPELRAGRMIHQAYFTYAAGDIIMCGYRNKDMCANVLRAGAFDAPLKYGTAPRVGTTINSALDYCYDLLKPGGACELTLPSTYAVWKIESVSQCHAPTYEKFTFTNPGMTNSTKSLLAVDYEARQEFEKSKTMLFQAYKTIIISLWFLAMLMEFKDQTIIFTWVMRFPDAAEFGEDAVLEKVNEENPEEATYTIQGVTSGHRMMVGILTFARFLITVILTGVGVSFLMKQTDYIDLLLDALALIFIVEVAEVLYSQVLRPEVRAQTENLEPMHVPMYGIDYLNRRPSLVDIIQLCTIVFVTLCWMTYYYGSTLDPIYDALQCTCIGVGENCREAQTFSYDFWHKYWKEDVPAVFKALDELKGSTGAPSPAAPAPSPAVAAGEDASPAPSPVAAAATSFNVIVPKVIQHAKHMLHRHWHPKAHHHRKHHEVLVEDVQK